MENGAYPEDFYELTPAEIHDLISSATKRREEDNRSRAVFAWHMAYLAGLAMNAPRKFPRSAAEHFPWLDTGQTSWQRHKAQMAQLAERHNRKFSEKM